MQTLVRPKLAVEVIQDRRWHESLAKEWQALQKEAENASVFQTWEWNAIWWRHFSDNKKPYVVCLRSGDRLVAIAALYESAGAWRALRFMGSGHSDYLDMIALKEYQNEAARRLISHLMRHKSAHLLDLHQLPHTSPVLQVAQRMPNAWRKLQAVCSRLELPEDWTAYLSYTGRNMRSNLKRYEQAASKEHVLTMRIACKFEVEHGLTMLFKLHGKRWRQRGQPGAMFAPKVQQFHRAFAKTAEENNWLRLHLIEFDGHAQAALYAFQFNGGYYFYQAGFDPRFSRFSPGTLALSHAVKTAIEQRCAFFDFMRGQENYKTRWKPQHSIYNYRVMIPLQGIKGQAAFTWNRLGDKMEHVVRERFEGGLGEKGKNGHSQE